jgi:predicted permease
MLDTLWQDLRYAVRALRTAPGFTLAAVSTLALGVGANVAIFSIFNQALLRELPLPAPEELVNLSSPGPKPGRTSYSGTFGRDAVFSYPLFRDLERDQTMFTGLAAHRDFAANVVYRGQASSETGFLVSGSYFPVLALRPALGRLLLPNDDRARDAGHVVVLSHQYWRTRFNADPGVLGDALVINGQPMTIVGVTPRAFTSTTLESHPQIFVPLTMAALMMPGLRDPHTGNGTWNGFDDRRDHWLYLFARLKPGMSRETAETAINGAFAGIINGVELSALRAHIGSDAERTQFSNRRLFLEPGGQGQRPERAELVRVLVLLFCVTGIVFLIACANVANLMLARGATRATDLTVRLAIGAGRGRLVRHLLLESCVLSAIGGIGGLIAAAAALHAIGSSMPGQWLATQFEPDVTMLAFALAMSTLTVLLVGLYPALYATRHDVMSVLKTGTTASASRTAARLRTGIATLQVALSTALLIVAGLFARSLLNMSRVDLGIDTESLATFRISPELSGYTAESSAVVFDRVASELLATPGVTGVTMSTVPLLAGVASGTNVTVEGFDTPPETNTGTVYARIGTEYFRTLGIPLIAGREFTEHDRVGSPKVAIINEAFARRFNLESNPIGKRMYLGAGRPPDTEIIGLVQDAKYSQLKDPPPAQFFVPYRQQAPAPGDLNFYVRSNVPAERIVALIPALAARVDATLAVKNLLPMTTQAYATVAFDRLIAALSAAFAGLATLLAGIGLFGVLSYAVLQRTREIGLRMALGADVGRVQRMVFGSVGWMTAVGGAAGLAMAFGLERVARSMLFEVEGLDPVVAVCSATGVALVALGAGILPALRAIRVDPVVALRAE